MGALQIVALNCAGRSRQFAMHPFKFAFGKCLISYYPERQSTDFGVKIKVTFAVGEKIVIFNLLQFQENSASNTQIIASSI
jgi:predicted DNA repair protein MutK